MANMINKFTLLLATLFHICTANGLSLDDRLDNGKTCSLNGTECKSRICYRSFDQYTGEYRTQGYCKLCEDSSPCKENERCSIEGWCKPYESEDELHEELEEQSSAHAIDEEIIKEDEESNTRPPNREKFNKTRIDDDESHVDEDKTQSADAPIASKNQTAVEPKSAEQIESKNKTAVNLPVKTEKIKVRPSWLPKDLNDKQINIEDKERSVKQYFYDQLRGNMYTHADKLLDQKQSFFDMVQVDLSSTFFAGVVGGDIPFYEDIYRADVHELKLQASVNITTTLAIQILNFARIELEVDIVPAVATASASAYTSSLLQDNCGWILYGWQLLGVRTTLSQTYAKCGFNLRNLVDDSSDWNDALHHLLDPLWLLQQHKCEFDEVLGKSQFKIDALSTDSLIDMSPTLSSYMEKWNRPPEWQNSYCFGSLDWAWFLVPDNNHHFQNINDKWNQQIKKDDYVNKRKSDSGN